MRLYAYYFSTLIILSIYFPNLAGSADLNGLWTKTTSPDQNNITIFFQEKRDVKAIGYSKLNGKNIVWFGVGEMNGNHFRLHYHHSINATPAGWEPDGIMFLSVSSDGNQITGTAKSKSGNWSGDITFARIR